MRDLPGGEAEVAEDDVLDALGEEVAAVRDRLDRVLADQPEDHREVVDAERPERVLVRAHDPEVLPVRVDAEHVAELARVDELLQLAHARVVEQEVAGHQDEVALGGERDELVHLGALHRRRLLDEDVLAGLERLLGERVVGRHRRRDHDRVELGVGQQLGEVGRRPARADSARRTPRAAPRRGRRATRGRRGCRSCARGSGPSSRARPGRPRAAHSFQTLSLRRPFSPVALRKSTITAPRRRAPRFFSHFYSILYFFSLLLLFSISQQHLYLL